MSDILDFLKNIKSMYKEYKHNININNNVQLGGNINNDNNDNNIVVQSGGERAESYDIVHYNDGIARKKEGKTFVYYYIDNNKPVSATDIKRINALKIPPAWIDVWVSRKATSSIQCVGTDIKNRKQYKYNEHHIKEAEEEKFISLISFIKDLPKLNKKLREHQKLDSYDKYKVISTIILLIQKLNLRIGKNVYSKGRNASFGASSLHKTHVKINGSHIYLNFMGKSKKRLSYSLVNQNISEHINMLLKLEGKKLFQYIEDDKIKNIYDVDLNKYIQDFMGDYTIKLFRTFGANFYFISSLLSETSKRLPKNDKAIQKNISNAIKITAHHLRHSKNISKKSYIMNFCINMYQNNPEFFVKRKNDDPNDVLMEVLLLYKKTISKDKN